MKHRGIGIQCAYDQIRRPPDARLMAFVDRARGSFNWADLEPGRGRYDWSSLDRFLGDWSAVPGRPRKRVIVAVKTAQDGGTSPSAFDATPAWVYGAGAKAVTFINTGNVGEGWPVRMPLYWDDTYLALYDDFVAALARRYDGHPTIDAFEIGVGDGGATKITSDKNGIAAFIEAGYTRPRFFDACTAVIEMTARWIRRRPALLFISAFTHPSDATVPAHVSTLAERAATIGIGSWSRALSENAEAMRKQGYSRILSEVSSAVRIGYGYDFPILKDTDTQPWEQSVADFQAYCRNAFGGGTTGLPPTPLSWLHLLVPDGMCLIPGYANPRTGRHFDERLVEAVEAARAALRRFPRL